MDSPFLTLKCLKQREWLLIFINTDFHPCPVCIHGQEIEVVEKYKYLGTTADEKLKFKLNTDTICAKTHQRMYLYRKLSGFNVDNIFYENVLVLLSLFSFSLICWFGSLSLKNKKRLELIFKLCSKVAAK